MNSVTVVLPTLNEEKNIPLIYEKLSIVLNEYDWQIIFVDDDSKDQSLSVIDDISRKDNRVRRIHRIGRAGLSSACIEGILASNSEYVIIMDADLQHDEALLPQMIKILSEEEVDLVVGSRYIDGGKVGEWSNFRHKISLFATWIARNLFKVFIKDPMSGFFAFRRKKIIPSLRKINSRGFKILFDIITSDRSLNVKEIPFTFRNRTEGISKLNISVLYEFYISMLCVLIKRKLPPEFISFINVGAIGIFIHALVLIMMMALGVQFIYSQFIAGFVAMNSNFFINNVTTHRSRKITTDKMFGALLMFYILCSLGLGYNIIVAEKIYEVTLMWPIAGLFGSLLSAIWNYATTSIFVWKSFTR